MPNELKKITALPSGTPADTDVVPFVDLATNTTKKALKSELKGDKGDAATADAGTTTTLAAGQSATVTNIGTTSAAIFNFAIPQGIQGITGATGAKVTSVAFSGNDIVFTLDDNSTVTLTNAKIDLKGDKGDQGIQGVQGVPGAKITSAGFSGNDLVFNLDDSSSVTISNAKTDLKGDKGDTGAKITSAGFVSDDLVFALDDSSTVTITGAKTALKGDKGDTGLTGIDWQGNWSAGTYTVTQSVSHNGSSWIATTTTTEEPSISATDWDLVALKGTDGAGSGDISGSGTANELAYFTAEKTIDNLPVATYPSLTEVSYVKGVTGAIQSQLNGKQATGSYEVTTNKETSALDTSTTKYPCNNVVKEAVDAKASLTGVETLTNKRINPRLVTATSYTTDTGTSLDVSTCDQFEITAQVGALKFNNPGGTPLNGQKLIIRIKDNGTAIALTYDTQFRAMGNALPSTTVVNKTIYLGFIFNATDTKFDLVAVAQEA